ncbi:MAG TPA: hypothetical protein VIL48_17215 [Acidimicrobiales bacterium]
MRHGIVEGEPGIFPEPIARLFRAIGRLFGRNRPGSDERSAPPDRRPVEDVVGVPDVSDLDPVRPGRPPADKSDHQPTDRPE